MTAVIFNQSCWIFGINDFKINDVFEDLLKHSQFSIFGSIDKNFNPLGYTKIWLLGESHFAIHTFPESDILYIELSSCNESKAERFWNNLQNWANVNSKKIFFMQENKYSPPEMEGL